MEDETLIPRVVGDLVAALRGVRGVEAIVLGGSRARGTHTATSDVDIGLYYAAGEPPELDALRALAERADDSHRGDLVTPVGQWGPWINGGGWLHVKGMPVDLLYRDLGVVGGVMDECETGRVQMAYQPGHPQGFLSATYVGEIALCRVLWDPHGRVAALKRRTQPYPDALRDAIVARFFWEAEFSLIGARKGGARRDVAYVAGCCFRCVACLLQTLFALNEVYWLNEKGALGLADGFAMAPARLAERVTTIFGGLAAEESQLGETANALAVLVEETRALLP